MLSELEIGQFRAFGFVVLKNCLSPAEVARITAAYDRVMPTAPLTQYFDKEKETRALMSFVQADDAFGALIEHPGVMEAMRDIWGTEALYIAGSDMWANFGDTPWHSDGQPGRERKTLKTAIYLDEMGPDTGPLNVVPGSHHPEAKGDWYYARVHPEFCAAIFQSCGIWDQGRPRLRLDKEKVPGTVSLYTKLGDVVLWDNRLWHSAFQRKDGKARRTMFIGYTPDPQDDLLAIEDVRAIIRQHISEKQPFVYSKEMMAKASPARQKMVARLEELGVKNVRE